MIVSHLFFRILVVKIEKLNQIGLQKDQEAEGMIEEVQKVLEQHPGELPMAATEDFNLIRIRMRKRSKTAACAGITCW